MGKKGLRAFSSVVAIVMHNYLLALGSCVVTMHMTDLATSPQCFISMVYGFAQVSELIEVVIM